MILDENSFGAAALAGSSALLTRIARGAERSRDRPRRRNIANNHAIRAGGQPTERVYRGEGRWREGIHLIANREARIRAGMT